MLKGTHENIALKDEIAQKEQFHLLMQCFQPCQGISNLQQNNNILLILTRILEKMTPKLVVIGDTMTLNSFGQGKTLKSYGVKVIETVCKPCKCPVNRLKFVFNRTRP